MGDAEAVSVTLSVDSAVGTTAGAGVGELLAVSLDGDVIGNSSFDMH